MQRISLLVVAALTLDGALAFAPGVALSLKQTRGCRFVQPARLSMQADSSKKETALDKLVGPKLFKSVEKVTGVHAVPIVPLRIVSGILMIHHGNEGGVLPANFGTEAFKGFIDFIMKPYFSFLPGDLSLWAALHDYAEFFGGIFLAIGFLTRPAALSLFLTMCGAVYFHLASTGLQGFPLGHVPSYSYNFEEPALYALIFLLFFFNGAGPLSVDSVIYSNISAEAEEE